MRRPLAAALTALVSLALVTGVAAARTATSGAADMSPLAVPAGGTQVTGLPLAATTEGVVFTAPSTGTTALLTTDGATSRVLQPLTPTVNDGAWGCGPSVVGLYTDGSTGSARTVVQWRDLSTGTRRDVTLAEGARPLGAAPRGWVYAQWGRGLVRVDGATLAETVIAPYAHSYVCDESGYAWSQRDETLRTETAYRRSWSGVTATPLKLGQTSYWMSLLALDGTTALWSDLRYDGVAAALTTVTVVRATAGQAPTPVWSGTRADVRNAVVTPGASAFTHVRETAAGVATAVTYVPLGGGPSTTDLAAARRGTVLADRGGQVVLGVEGGADGGLRSVGAAGVTAITPWWLPAATARTGFVPLSPARIMDTRRTLGGTRLLAGSHRVLQVTGQGGVAPGAVTAVALNVTVVGPTGKGWVTTYPTDAARPNASSLNYVAGQTVANHVITKVSADGAVTLFSQASTDLVVDVTGYYPAGSAYVPLVPSRVLPATPMATSSTRTVPVLGRGGVPASGVDSVVVNLTAVSPAATGWLTTWPSGVTRPNASNVNYSTGQTIAGLAIVKVGAGGAVDVFTRMRASVIVDVVGYLPSGGDYTGITPARLTRQAVGAGATTTVKVTGVAGIPSTGVKAVLLNTTVTQSATAGYLTLYPAGAARPTASTLNHLASAPISNSALAKVGADGSVTIWNTSATTLIVDVSGYLRQ